MHLVAKLAEEEAPQQGANASTSQTQQSPNLNLEEQILGNIGNIIELPFLRPNRRQRRRRSILIF